MKMIMKRSKNFLKWLDKCKEVHQDKYSYENSEYLGSKEKLNVTCPIHGNFLIRADRHSGGQGCKKCNGWKGTLDDFINKAVLKHNGIYNYDKFNYNGSKAKSVIICTKHGEFLQNADNHLQGKGCPQCAVEVRSSLKRTSEKEFFNNCTRIHDNFYTYKRGSFIDWDSKMTIICPEHGEFSQRASAHLYGQGCPKCILWKEEAKLFKILEDKFPNLEIVSQYSPDWLGKQRIDIGIPSLKIGIEYNGEQHYKYIPFFHKGGIADFDKQLKRDNRKRNKCLMNNYKLIEIKFNYSEEEIQELIDIIYGLMIGEN